MQTNPVLNTGSFLMAHHNSPVLPPDPAGVSFAALLVGKTPRTNFSDTQWIEIVSLARRQTVGALLYWQLHKMDVKPHTNLWDKLKRAYSRQIQLYLQRKDAFQKISRSLRHAEIPALWLKGFALAHSVYPNPALRPMRDLDVLVPLPQREHALTLVQELGYLLAVPAHSQATQEMWHHYPLRGSVAVELHYALIGLRSKILPASQLEWFWTQTRVIHAGEMEFSAFTPEAELLYLCAHAILQHGETEFILQRYLDLHLLIEKNPALDWQLIMERAIELRWTYAVARALEITRAYFGTTLPENFLEELQTRRRADEDAGNALWILPNATRLEATRSFMHGMSRSEKWKWFWSSLFPTPAYMKWKYEIRAEWQIPFFYFYRWFVIARDVVQTVLKCFK